MQRRQIRHRESTELTQTKITPRTRPTHEAAHDGALLCADMRTPWTNSERKYVYAPEDPKHSHNYAYYESMGYTIEHHVKDGVRIKMGDNGKVGDPLKWRGNLLMSCSVQRAQEIFESGPTGLTGQKYYDKLMSKIRKNELEKRSHVPGTSEELDTELEQVGLPNGEVFRE